MKKRVCFILSLMAVSALTLTSCGSTEIQTVVITAPPEAIIIQETVEVPAQSVRAMPSATAGPGSESEGGPSAGPALASAPRRR